MLSISNPRLRGGGGPSDDRFVLFGVFEIFDIRNLVFHARPFHVGIRIHFGQIAEIVFKHDVCGIVIYFLRRIADIGRGGGGVAVTHVFIFVNFRLQRDVADRAQIRAAERDRYGNGTDFADRIAR